MLNGSAAGFVFLSFSQNKISICLGITVWRICFVDIVVSCDLLCCCAAN